MSGVRGLSILAIGLLSGCSPYLYAPEITTFSDGVAKLRASQLSMDAAYTVAVDQPRADSARPGGKAFMLSSECFASGSSCTAGARPDHPAVGPTPREAAAKALQEADPGVGAPPAVAHLAPRGCTAPPVPSAAHARPEVTPDTMIAALEAYSKALATVTNAKDRADFDVASTALAASASALAGLMIGGPAGAGGAAVATLVIDAARYGVAVSLDARRFKTLRCAVLRSQDAVAVLGILVGASLSLEVDRMRTAYRADGDAITRNMSLPRPAGKWEDNVARQQALASKLNDLHGADPAGAAAAMVKANDALARALRDEDHQVGALAMVVGDFAAKAGAIQRAVAAH